MLRVIGDIHGDFKKYAELTKDCEWSIQLGDFGFNYASEDLKDVDSSRHKFFPGNHDQYDTYEQTPRSLGDYGVACMGGVEFFYIRGAFSIDKRYRLAYERGSGLKTWWDQEELSYSQMCKCVELYELVRPEIVITHTCPRTIAGMVGDDAPLKDFGFDPETFSTSTQDFLEHCIELHQPKQWYFGHFHKNWSKEWAGTQFRCIDVCDYVDIGE